MKDQCIGRVIITVTVHAEANHGVSDLKREEEKRDLFVAEWSLYPSFSNLMIVFCINRSFPSHEVT